MLASASLTLAEADHRISSECAVPPRRNCFGMSRERNTIRPGVGPLSAPLVDGGELVHFGERDPFLGGAVERALGMLREKIQKIVCVPPLDAGLRSDYFLRG